MERGTIKKGFRVFRNTVKNDYRRLKQIRSCTTCKYFYKDKNSNEEICHNNSVTSYDMTETSNTKYCTFWTPVWIKD